MSNYEAFKTSSGRWIPARWDSRGNQYVTPVCCSGFLYAFARTIDALARETGRTYATRQGALRAVRRELGG